MTRITVKYYNIRMLQTLDINSLIISVWREFGDSCDVLLCQMNREEQNSYSHIVDGMNAIDARILVFEENPSGEETRRIDLEDSAT